jgi:hypothetical protein
MSQPTYRMMSGCRRALTCSIPFCSPKCHLYTNMRDNSTESLLKIIKSCTKEEKKEMKATDCVHVKVCKILDWTKAMNTKVCDNCVGYKKENEEGFINCTKKMCPESLQQLKDKLKKVDEEADKKKYNIMMLALMEVEFNERN